jgi:hypothetical protein
LLQGLPVSLLRFSLVAQSLLRTPQAIPQWRFFQARII